MKSISIFIAFFIIAVSSMGQSSLSSSTVINFSPKPSKRLINYDRNILKLNVTSIPFKNYCLQYERLTFHKTSLSLGFRYMKKTKLPKLQKFESLIDDKEAYEDLQNTVVGNYAITPEMRFYLGQQNGARGFYFAVYGRYSQYDFDIYELEYTVEIETGEEPIFQTSHADINGKFNSITAGLMLGAQWRVGRRIYLDWWILGASYGRAKGKIAAVTMLRPDEEVALYKELKDSEIPFGRYTISEGKGSDILNFKGPWAGVRAGLSCGVRF